MKPLRRSATYPASVIPGSDEEQNRIRAARDQVAKHIVEVELVKYLIRPLSHHRPPHHSDRVLFWAEPAQHCFSLLPQRDSPIFARRLAQVMGSRRVCAVTAVG